MEGISSNAGKRLFAVIKNIEMQFNDEYDYEEESESESSPQSPTLIGKISESKEKRRKWCKDSKEEKELDALIKKMEILDDEFDKMPGKYDF